jgi:hypothetical protein
VAAQRSWREALTLVVNPAGVDTGLREPACDRPAGATGCWSVPTRGPRLASVTAPDGREVVLLSRVWEEKITRDHPELVDHLDAVIETVARPDNVEPDSRADRSRFYRRDVGPSRWLLVVVSFEQAPARIITALANRKDPKQWKP